jgi:hypothetical protein
LWFLSFVENFTLLFLNYFESCLILINPCFPHEVKTIRYEYDRRLLGALIVLRHNNINEDLIIRLNDSGATFDEIVDYLDRICN